MRIFPKAAIVLVLLTAGATLAMARDFSPRQPSLKQSGHWEWNWDGEDALGVAVPATVHYQRGGPARIVITGPDALLEKLEVGQGQIHFCQDCRNGPGRLDITVSGTPLRRVSLSGANIDIQLGRLDEAELRLSISGTGQISAEGRADDVQVNVSGAGAMHLERLNTRRADINIAGSGDVSLTPREDANISVAGSGRIWMKTKPPRLKQSVVGSGGVRIAGD